MKIAVNARLIIKDKMDGIGWFSWETFTRMAAKNPEHHFMFFFDRKPSLPAPLPQNVTPIVVPPITRLPFLTKLWHKYSVPFALKFKRPDIYISPDMLLPSKSNTPSIVVIHDLNFEHFPELFPKKFYSMFKNGVKNSASSAKRIATVSEFSKKDIENTYGVGKEKIDVVFSGINSCFVPLKPEEISAIKNKFNTGDDYFLVSGTLLPRKNPYNIVKGFRQFKNKYSGKFKLVFAGKTSKEIVEKIKTQSIGEPFFKDIIFTGRVSNHDMNGLFRGASALVHVSFYEGFGLPLLEAAVARIPVIASKGSALEEISNGSSLLVDPASPTEIGDSMYQLITDKTLATNLVEKSKELPLRYTWDKTANLLWESVKKGVEA